MTRTCKNAPKPKTTTTRRRPPVPAQPQRGWPPRRLGAADPAPRRGRPLGSRRDDDVAEIAEALGRARRADAPAARRVPVGSRAGRALDRPAHRRGGLRARRRRARAATTPSCSTSSATCCSRSTSCRCCSRSAARGTSAEVAEHCRQKLIRRHPHVFGEVEVDDARRGAAQLGRDQAREAGREPGIFGEVPENLPGAALRAQGPAPRASPGSTSARPLRGRRGELEELAAARRRERRLPRGRRRAVRRRQRRAQAEGRPRAGAARRGRALPRRVEAAEALAARGATWDDLRPSSSSLLRPRRSTE